MEEKKNKDTTDGVELRAGEEQCEKAGTNPCQKSGADLNRRDFLLAGAGVAGSLMIGNIPALAAGGAGDSNKGTKMTKSVADIQGLIKGKVLTKTDPEFKTTLLDTWNKYFPSDRMPEMIVKVAEEQDVVEAVKYAKEHKLKVAIRGGGHNWCNPSIRNSGMLIDLTALNKVISIDTKAKRAVTQPIVSNREMQKALNAHGLSYPTGHCPQVKMSGYLLSGGMSWNQGVWGPGVGSIEAIEMVTSEGKMITASKTENPEYFWAARGAGCGLFAVALRYHLNLYDLPSNITCSSYYFPIGEYAAVANWVETVSKKLPNNVEFSMWFMEAPQSLQEKAKADNGKVCQVTATMFANSVQEAKDGLKLLQECPLIDKCIQKEELTPATFEQLFDFSGALWPEFRRNKVDALFLDTKLADIFGSIKDQFVKSPSKENIIMFAVFTGPNVPAPLLDTAFSQSAKYYGGPWSMWKTPEEDNANVVWHEDVVKSLNPLISGRYISESDTVGHPSYLEQSYKPKNWERLAELRKKYDPDGVFFNYTDGLN